MRSGAQIVGSDLILGFALTGEAARLSLPRFEGVQRGDRLWEHTCFEAFVGVEGQLGYLEFNFAPNGEWAAYRFHAYRQGMTPTSDVAPEMSVRRVAVGLEIAARVPIGALSPGPATLRIGLCAVIEEASAALSYWALRHPPGSPDFHHPDARTLRLDLAPQPGAPCAGLAPA